MSLMCVVEMNSLDVVGSLIGAIESTASLWVSLG